MDGIAIALVLASALLHAAWNARAKAGDDRIIELMIAYVVGVVLLCPWLVVDPPTGAIGFMVLSGLAHGGYITFLSKAYQGGGLATTYPLARGTAPLLVALAGVWLLGQTPSVRTVSGAMVVALGLTVIGGVAWGRGEQRAILMALMTAVFIASYTLFDARGIEQAGELGYYAGASIVAVLVVAGSERASVTRIRASLRPGIRIGLVATSAYALVLFAYSRADAANVATLRGTSILFSLAFVRRTVTPRIVVGALAVFVGAVLVAA